MDLAEVERVLQRLDDHSVRYWVLGGWGVDALVGNQTREHRDLDLAVDATQWDASVGAAQVLGYVLETDWWPIRVELASSRGWIDLHPVRFAGSGDGVQAGPDGTTFDYPREHLVTGVLGGRTVPCVSAAWQVRVHAGYELRPQDRHDLAVLASLMGQSSRAADGLADASPGYDPGPDWRYVMPKELHVVNVETDEVVERVDVSRRDSAEVERTRETLQARIEPGHEVRDVD